jgi:SAM-dependent methyltransferase
MGMYADHILPWLTHQALKSSEVSAERRVALADVEGDVLELGMGSGLNLPHYGPGVRRVVGVEPSRGAARMAERAIRAVGFPVEIVPSTAEAIVFESRFDAVVSTFTLCTIPDVRLALVAARRALRPGGRIFFLEHGLSSEPRVQKWQRRFETIQKRICGGCHLTRDPGALLEGAGFAVSRLDTFYMKGPRPWTFLYRGSATLPPP